MSPENKIYAALASFWMENLTELNTDIAHLLSLMFEKGWHEPHAEG